MGDGAGGCAELAADELLAARADRRGIGWVFEAAADEGFEFVGVLDDDGRIGGEKGGDDVAEVPGVGAEGNGGAVGGRFDHVLSAAEPKLPPTKAMWAVPHQAPSSPTVSTRRMRRTRGSASTRG